MTGRMADPHPNSLDKDIQQIASSAQTDDEVLRAWQRAFNERVALPCVGFVIGEPVSVVAFCYDGNPRRGLTARCRRADDGHEPLSSLSALLREARVAPALSTGGGARGCAAHR